MAYPSGSAVHVSLPPGAWDSHVHVIDEERFPFAPDHAYRPRRANLTDLLHFEKAIGGTNVCLIAASIYGTDNRIILDALPRLKGRGRAVVAIDPDTIKDEELDHMHRLGVRGVRINLKSTGESPSKEELETLLFKYADRIRSRKWLIQIYLGVRVVIDHMGSPSPSKAAKEQPGYSQILKLLSQGLIWVKLSGTYRFAALPELDDYARTLIRTNSRQVVWASDWPHTGGVEFNPNGDPNALQDYRKIDDAAFIRQVFGWCDDSHDLIERVFVDNARRLWTDADRVKQSSYL